MEVISNAAILQREFWIDEIQKFGDNFSENSNHLEAAAIESIGIAKNESLAFLAMEREKIMRMTRDEALKELIKVHKIDNKIKTIQNISDNGLFSIK